MPRNKVLLFFFIILAVASFFRLWQLDKIPPGLYPDVAINGNDALETLRTGNFKVFYPENNGREGLMMWLIALSFSIFGVSVWSIKIVAAIIGILTVLGLYLLTKEIFQENSKFEALSPKQILNSNFQNSKQFGIWNLKNWNLFRISNFGFRISRSEVIALLASFFLATSFWHTNFSRIGFRAILLPFILVFGFYFLFRGLRVKKLSNFIVAGVFFGLGFYTYISYRFIVLLFPLILICWWLIYRKQNLQKKYLSFLFYFFFFIFLTILPIGLYFLQNPQDFIGRAAPISIFATEHPLKEFGKSLILHLRMFNFDGDFNWRHNFAGSPMLFWPVGILFLIGIILSLREIFRKSNYQNENYRLLSTFYFLLSTFFVMLLPGILTYEGIPHALRTIGVIPVVYIFAGFGSWKVYQFFNQNMKIKKSLFIASLLFIIIVGVFEFNKYFCVWAKNYHVQGAFTKRFAEIGYYLNSLPPDFIKYVIVNEAGVRVPYPNGIPMPSQTVMFIENIKISQFLKAGVIDEEGYSPINYLLPSDLDKIKINKKPTIVLLMQYNQNLFNELQILFPQGKIQERNEILIFEIK